MNLQSFKKYFFIVLLIPITFFTFTYFNAQNSSATITQNNQNEYTVDNGDDLFRILRNDSTYWSNTQNPKPNDLKVNVSREITLPSEIHTLNNFNSVEVDFHHYQFYVSAVTGSVMKIDQSNNSKITLSNVDINNTTGSNSAYRVPNPNGKSNDNHFYSTYYGILFSPLELYRIPYNKNNPEITYNNVNYNIPNDTYYNQPLCSYYVPINFTGTNNITTTNIGQQLGEISNIHVSSGTTTLSGSGNFAGGMFTTYPNNSTFPIDVDSNANLNLINNSNTQMFNNISGSTMIINNSGNLNIKNTNKSFVPDLTNKFILNANSNSNTSLISNSLPILPNNIDKNKSSITLNSVAKFLAYSNSPISEPAINTIFNGNGQIQQFNFKSNPADYNSNLGTYSAKSSFSNGYTRKFGKDLLAAGKYAFSVTSGQKPLQFLTAPTENYRWDIPINKLKSYPNYVPRTDGNDFSFNVEDDSQQDFSISASYSSNPTPQPFKMFFKKDDNAEKDIELNQTPKLILSKNEMDHDGNNYKKSFDTSHGLIIKADNHVKAKSYSGTVDWTVANTPTN